MGMRRSFVEFFHDLQRYITPFGVRVLLKTMDVEKPGEFDGLSITVNPEHNREWACYYLAHSFGSIVQWSTDFEHAQKVFRELRDAKKHREKEPARFGDALKCYQQFEQTSSEHAVWMLADIGRPGAIGPYTVFFRADIEAMTMFHRTGHAPRWRDFYAQWKHRAAGGEVWIERFNPENHFHGSGRSGLSRRTCCRSGIRSCDRRALPLRARRKDDARGGCVRPPQSSWARPVRP